MSRAQRESDEVPTAMPEELAGWTARIDVTAAVDATAVGLAPVAMGHAITAMLSPTGHVQYLAPLQKHWPPPAFGGLLDFTVTNAGVHRIILGSGAWIEIFDGGTPMKFMTNAQTPKHWGVRKNVDFHLPAARYILQLSGSVIDRLPVLIVRIC
jgi:hypothetical protein